MRRALAAGLALATAAACTDPMRPELRPVSPHAEVGGMPGVPLSQITTSTPGMTLGQGDSVSGNTYSFFPTREVTSPHVDARSPESFIIDVGSPVTTHGSYLHVLLRTANGEEAGVRLYADDQQNRIIYCQLSGEFLGFLDPSLRYLRFTWEPGVGIHIAQSASPTGPFQVTGTGPIPAAFTSAELASTTLALTSNGFSSMTLVPQHNTKAAAVLAFMGVSGVPSVADVQARGGVYARYESDFANGQDYWWSHTAFDSVGRFSNFYDRASIYYIWWARTGNPVYLDRANKLALGERDYLSGIPHPGYAGATLPTPYYPVSYYMMIDGVALHALVNDDSVSASVVAHTADAMGEPSSWYVWAATSPGNDQNDSRNSAKILSMLLDAYLLHVPSPAGFDYAERLRTVESGILSTQNADGAYHWANQCGLNKPYMNGMLNDALIRYHTQFEADPRIVTSVKAAVDYMWANDWYPASSAFTYLAGYCASSDEGGGPPGAPDLNNLIVSGFAFVGRQTGDPSYYAKADAIFAGGVTQAYYFHPKDFNQEYTASYRYLTLRPYP